MSADQKSDWRNRCPLFIKFVKEGNYKERIVTVDLPNGLTVSYLKGNFDTSCSFQCAIEHGCEIKVG